MIIYAISDQHGTWPTIPPCDLLIVAGDQCLDYFGGMWARDYAHLQLNWFTQTWMAWREKQPAKHCVVTWGNHDFCGELAPASPIIEIGGHTTTVVDALFEYEGVKIWFSPWSRQFMDWAFMAEEEQLAEKYARIPTGIDILVSHDPPYGYGDKCPGAHNDDCPVRWHTNVSADKCTCGCEAHVGGHALLNTIDRVMPDVVICGHIHGGHGTYTRDIDYLGEKHDCTHEVTIYNVAVVDEQYKLVHPATEIIL